MNNNNTYVVWCNVITTWGWRAMPFVLSPYLLGQNSSTVQQSGEQTRLTENLPVDTNKTKGDDNKKKTKRERRKEYWRNKQVEKKKNQVEKRLRGMTPGDIGKKDKEKDKKRTNIEILEKKIESLTLTIEEMMKERYDVDSEEDDSGTDTNDSDSSGET